MDEIILQDSPSVVNNASKITYFVKIPAYQRFLFISIIFSLLFLYDYFFFTQKMLFQGIELVALTLNINIIILLFPFFFYQRNYGWIHPLVVTSILGLSYHLSRPAIYITGLNTHPAIHGFSTQYLNSLISKELILSSISLVIYYVGYFYAPRFRMPNLKFYPPKNLRLTSIVFVALSIIILIIYIQYVRGGLAKHLLSWSEGRSRTQEGEFYWSAFVDFSWLSCLMWFAYDKKAYLNATFWICSFTAIAGTFLTNGGREQALLIIICSVIIWIIRDSKIKFSVLIISGVLVIFLIGFLGSFRNSSYTGAKSSSFETSSLTDFLVDQGVKKLSQRNWEFNSLLPILAYVPEQVNYLYGETFAGLVVSPVPRSIWPGKPYVSLGRRAGAIFFNLDLVSIPAGPLGEAYWNFGVFGVAVIFLLFGIFHSYLAQLFVYFYNVPFTWVIYALVIYLLTPEAIVIQHVLGSLVNVVVLLFVYRIVRFSK